MKKDKEAEEFERLVQKLHDNGDLRVLKKYITILRNECRSRRYDPRVIENIQLLTSVSGEEQSLDHILDEFEAILDM